MSERWTPEEVLVLFGSSKKHVEITEDDLQNITDILNNEAGDEPHPLDEIALRSMVGLLASGQYADAPRAAGVAAWTECVPGFLTGKNTFLAIGDTLMATTAPTIPDGLAEPI
jgi:hypothetical protein